jgi:hypothetical protein
MNKILPLLFLSFFTLHFSASAQKPVSQVDFNQFVKEIAITQSNPNQLRMSMWFPASYWNIVAQANPNFTPAMVKEITTMLEDYVIVCVVEAKLNHSTMKFDPLAEWELRKKLSIQVGEKTFNPVPVKDLPEDVLSVKDIVEPLFAQMLGELGSGMTIFYFKIQDTKGNNLINEYQKGSFSIRLNGASLTYNLPLPSLYDDKICPTDKAAFPANYSYCPFHGVELTEVQHEDILPQDELKEH